MAINKVSIVLLMLLVVAALADAHVDRFELSSKPEIAGHSKVWCSYNCECRIEDGTTKCYHTDFKTSYSAECPSSCKDRCICNRMYPPTCSCSHEVDSCCGSGNLLGY